MSGPPAPGAAPRGPESAQAGAEAPPPGDGELLVGLMSGTSLDGVDALLVRLSPPGPQPRWQVLQHVALPMPPALRTTLLTICREQAARLATLGRVEVELARWYAQAVQVLLARAGVPASAVRAIGNHGQTVHHEPEGDAPFTMQLGDPNTLAVLTGIPVVADFRRRDMALGGQGAPLAPGLHELLFRDERTPTVVLNTGGIANVTLLWPGQPTRGWDTGPANVLMDGWAERHFGQPFDADGAIAARGRVHPGLLQRLLADPFFARPGPKSTGREHFHLGWLDAALASLPDGAAPAPQDVMRTLLELTVRTVADAVQREAVAALPAASTASAPSTASTASAPSAPSAPSAAPAARLWVCGGGALHPGLMQGLAGALPGWTVRSTADAGLPPQQVEALAFAVFAQRTVWGLPASLPSVTGARRACLLGSVVWP